MPRRLIILAALVAGACKQETPQPLAVQASQQPSAAPAAPDPPAPSGKAISIKEQSDLFGFEYDYPAQAAAIPALKAQLDAELDEARSGLADMAREGRGAAKEAGFDYNPYQRSISWAVVTELPGWLSLSGTVYEFTGGAHGNHGTSALLWDKAAGRRREPSALFTSKAAFDAALREPFCAALDQERKRRRDQPVDRAGDNPFDECLDPSSLTVLLGSADKRHFTRIGVIADPYAAGPYAEGSYEVTLQVTPALLKALRPEYRAAFALGR